MRGACNTQGRDETCTPKGKTLLGRTVNSLQDNIKVDLKSFPSSAEVKECVELYLHSPNEPSRRGTHLKNTGTTLPLPVNRQLTLRSAMWYVC
jgi:hypothetical protein